MIITVMRGKRDRFIQVKDMKNRNRMNEMTEVHPAVLKRWFFSDNLFISQMSFLTLFNITFRMDFTIENNFCDYLNLHISIN